MHHLGALSTASLFAACAGLVACSAAPAPALPAAPLASTTTPAASSVVTVPPAPTASVAPADAWIPVAISPPPGCDVPRLSVARSSCEKRVGSYCGQIGRALDEGEPGPVDAAARRACADWYHHRACDLRDINGCHELAAHLAKGISAAPIAARIIALLTAECARPEGESACVQLGISYEIGRDAGRDEARAEAIYRKACADVPAERCVDLARGVPPLAAKTLLGTVRVSLEKACGGADAAACMQLGTLNEEGRGAPKDLPAAAKLYRRACDGGVAAGCTALANVARDPAAKAPRIDSAALLAKTCEGGDADACAAYADSPGLSTDEVFKALSRACGGGQDHACWRLSHDPSVVPPP
jgi:hypothetical protein